MNIIPKAIVDAFGKRSMLQLILLAVLVGVALFQIGERVKSVIDAFLQCLFRIARQSRRWSTSNSARDSSTNGTHGSTLKSTSSF